MGWAAVIKELIALIRKFGGAITAYFAGRKSKADEIARKNLETENQLLKQRLEREREIARRTDDDAERRRVLRDFTRPGEPSP